MSQNAPNPPIPARLGPYVLGRRLGGGGMGDVYEATHLLMKSRRVALKVLKPQLASRPERIQRFLREIEALGVLKPHPNVVRAEFADIVDGNPFLVMEHIEGVDLGRIVKERGSMEVAEACACVLQAADGLSAIHQAGLVHRDLKPSNLMLAPDGLVKILDLGLARLQFDDNEDRTKAEELTSADAILGTLDFTAPEQLEDPRGVDIRADIYSLGCTLYKLLTGAAPFAVFTTPSQKIRAHAVETFPRLPESAPLELQAILDRMTARNRDERYALPGDVVEAISPLCRRDSLEATVSAAKRLYATGFGLNPAPPVKEPPTGQTPEDASPTATFARPQQKRIWGTWLLGRNTAIGSIVMGLAIAAMIAVIRRSDSGPVDIDLLEPMKWHSLFLREPEKILWPVADRTAHTTFDKEIQHFFVTTNDIAYFKLASTRLKNFKIQVTMNTAAWERVGLFIAYRSKEQEKSLTGTQKAKLHYVSFATQGVPETPILERGVCVFDQRKDRTVPRAQTLKQVNLAPRAGERVLEIEVSEDNLIRVFLDNVPMNGLREINN
ncbi:MAG: serine/threonine-protein kinase, partial [Gemmataceae bacterium]